MLGGVARSRLAEERKAWRKDHPHGFVAKPATGSNGSINLMEWHCIIPGREGTDWEGGYFPLTINFSEDYPCNPPICKFPQGFFHPNVYPSGMVCLSILSTGCEHGWKPAITVKQMLVGIQLMLENPNPSSPANHDANTLYVSDSNEYRERVQQQARRYPPSTAS